MAVDLVSSLRGISQSYRILPKSCSRCIFAFSEEPVRWGNASGRLEQKVNLLSLKSK